MPGSDSRRPRRPRRSAVPRSHATALLHVCSVLALLGLTGPVAAAPAPSSLDLAAQRDAAATRPSRDTVRDDQWQLSTLQASTAWKLSTGDGVTVAVIDSGVNGSHTDLRGKVLPGIDLVTGGGNGQDDQVGHGTTVAALIAGRDDDQRGVVGLAPDADILPVRVLDADNRYDDARVVAEGVRWAVDHGADVINMSLGGGASSQALAEAIDYAFQRDVVVVACVGNVSTGGPGDIWYPAREPGVLAVTALTRDSGQPLWDGALTGEQTVLAAPGADLVGARPGGYWRVQGTSFATPLVSATAALVRARWPEMSAANVVERLIRTARDTGPAGRDDQFGFGVVDPVAALTADVPLVAANVLDTVPPPGRSGLGRAPGVPEADMPVFADTTPVAVTVPAYGGGNSFAAALFGVAFLVCGTLTVLRRLSRRADRSG